MTDHMDYRLALILPEFRQLLGIKGSDTAQFPHVTIPKWERPAEQLTRLIEEKWQIKTIVLDVLAGSLTAAPLAVIEVRSLSPQFEREELRPIDPDRIGRGSVSEDDRHTLVSILSGDDARRSPFCRIGWIEEAQRWIRGAVRNRTCNFTEDILQLSVCGRFALVRFGTEEGPAYWLKAVGTPNEHEFPITKALGERFPNHLPTIVAMRDDWNAWVMEEAGQPLRDSFTLPSIERAAIGLAELQRETIDHLDPLRAAGCLDRSIPVLATHLPEIMEYLEDAMNRQTSTKVPRIEASRLRELESILRDACSRMQNVGVPDTLIHNDINTGNILLTRSRCVFTDWAEAYIGNPFLSFQHLCAQISAGSDHAEAWLPQVRNAYKKLWLEWLTESAIDQAFALMPILAIASYLYGRGAWLHSSSRDNPQFQGYSRSLARCMDRAARAPQLLEALWP